MIKCQTLIVVFACILLLAGCVTVPPEEKLQAAGVGQRVINAPSDRTGEEPGINENSTLDDYLRHAFAHNPGLWVAFERHQAALARIPQSQALDDPALSFEYFLEQKDTRYQVGLTQSFPAFGTLSLREKKATAEADAAGYAADAERLALFDRVIKAFHEYHYLSRATQVTEEAYRLLTDLEQVVDTRYRTGAAPFSDLIKTQVEKDRIASDLESLRDERASQSAGLAALLNLPVYDVLPWPGAMPSGAAIMDAKTLDDMLGELNPELKAAGAMIAAETVREQLARRNFLPGIMLGANWMAMPGADGQGDETDVSVMAGITLPLWRGKYRAEIREAEAMRRAATGERDNMQNRLKAELSMAIVKFRTAERRMDLFRGSLIPKAEQALEVAQQDFSSGKVDFMTLIDGRRTWLEFRLMLERATADREIAMGEIGCCIGVYSIASTPGENDRNPPHNDQEGAQP
jgi:cobalt-zinc-cadmium efflux system outer membrane protein